MFNVIATTCNNNDKDVFMFGIIFGSPVLSEVPCSVEYVYEHEVISDVERLFFLQSTTS